MIKAKSGSTYGEKYSYTDSNIEIGFEYCYKIEAIQLDGNRLFWGPKCCLIDLINDYEKTKSPRQHNLYQNFPNPFNHDTCLKFYSSDHSFTQIIIYNSVGQIIKILYKKTTP